MTARGPLPLVVGFAASLVVGSGLAALASAPPDDACSDFGNLREGATSAGALELWPLGRRCDYEVGGQTAYSAFFVPTAAELYAWIVGAALLLAIATLRGDLAAARGATAAATLLAMAGAAWHYAGIQLAFIAMTLFGAPLAGGLDYLLRPPAGRELSASFPVAVAVAAVTFCGIVLAAFEPLVGIAFGLLASALISGYLARVREPGSWR